MPCKEQSTVLEMNTLLLFLFLGASVALAELPLDHETLVEFLNKEDEELVGEEMADEENEEGEELFGEEMADEENDPRRPRPSPPPYVVKFFVSHSSVSLIIPLQHIVYS